MLTWVQNSGDHTREDHEEERQDFQSASEYDASFHMDHIFSSKSPLNNNLLAKKLHVRYFLLQW